MIKNLFLLFYDFFKIATFVVGGGYAIIAVADDVFSRKRRWLREGELIEQLAIFQMIPGIMAGHAAVYVGRRVAGLLGSFVAIIAVALPSILIFSLVASGYEKIPRDNIYLNAAFAGLRAAITGVILAMTIRSWKKSIATKFALAIFLLATIAIASKISVVVVAIVAILIGLFKVAISRARDANRDKEKKFSSISFAPLLFLQYGFLAFGGGYVLIPFYLRDFVGPMAPYLQIPSEEFANLIALTQMTPGPIGINGATFFGFKMFGFCGAVATSICLLIPGFIILSLALMSLDRFRENEYVKSVLAMLRPVTLAMMAIATWSFASMSCWSFANDSFAIDIFSIMIVIATVVAMMKTKIGIVKLIFISAAISIAKTFF